MNLTVEQLEKILIQFLKDQKVYEAFMISFRRHQGVGRSVFLYYLDRRLSSPETCIAGAFLWSSPRWRDINRDWQRLVQNKFEGYLNNTTLINIF